MLLRSLTFALVAIAAFAAGNPVASRLAKEAKQAQNAGRLVRAYLLYAEAAARDNTNTSYAVNRDALAPLANLLITSHVENVDVSGDIEAAESGSLPPDSELSLDLLPPLNRLQAESLLPPPSLQFDNSSHDFDLRVDEKTAITQVAQAYKIQTVFDPDFDAKPLGRFTIDRADFKTAMEGLTEVTHTFVFPISPNTIFVARDNEIKRNEYEPNVEITIPLNDSTDPKEIVEAANAVRGALRLRTISWDSAGKTIVIRDRVNKARIARSLLEALLLPRAQLSIDVQLIAVDTDVSYHYGLGLPTASTLLNFAHLGGFGHPLPDLSNVTSLLIFGGGTNFFGLTLSSVSMFAAYTRSSSKVLYDATVVVGDGQTAELHVGEKYPIANALYTGFASTASPLANPISVTQEDLGLTLKLGARVNGQGDISIETDAQYNSLGNQTYNTVPAINQRQFKGAVRLREGECAIVAGLEQDDHTTSRSGIAGLSQIPGLDQVLAENSRDHSTSNTLILIKPTVTRLPMSDIISPQFLLGSDRGARVIL